VADGAGVVADAGRPRFPTALPAVWNLPYRRNPSFTGREQELAELAGQLGRLGPDHPDTVLSRQRLAAVAAALDEPAQLAG
jgi:hypothetical protein